MEEIVIPHQPKDTFELKELGEPIMFQSPPNYSSDQHPTSCQTKIVSLEKALTNRFIEL
jgi:hypothetical protein